MTRSFKSTNSKISTLIIMAAICMLGAACSQKAKKVEQPAPVAKATQEEKKSDDLSIGCLVKGDLRIIELEKSTGRCEVHYTKNGEKSEVAWAEATPSLCSKVQDQIRSNIESAGFKCDNDIAQLKQERKSASLKTE